MVRLSKPGVALADQVTGVFEFAAVNGPDGVGGEPHNLSGNRQCQLPVSVQLGKLVDYGGSDG
jgi:hypothetical protein